MTEVALLSAARRGDEQAFSALVDEHRGPLQAHCYRMLGSFQDAEDAVQEAMVQAWRGIGRFEGRSSLRSWLYAVATNCCLRLIERRPRRIAPGEYGPPSDPANELSAPSTDMFWIETFPDQMLERTSDLASPDVRYELSESVELAFVAALQHLPAMQRAALILRDVLGFSSDEVATAVDTSTASVNSALQRARKTVDERLPERSQLSMLREIGDDEVRKMIGEYVDAWHRRDIDSVVAMLSEDVKLTMPPIPDWFSGRAAVSEFLARKPLSEDKCWSIVPIGANGQIAQAYYLISEDSGEYEAHSIDLLTLRGREIVEITAFLEAKSFAAYGLPQTVASRLPLDAAPDRLGLGHRGLLTGEQ
jgi:RNA polymerase sigma-70 factor (ECF subfamily)